MPNVNHFSRSELLPPPDDLPSEPLLLPKLDLNSNGLSDFRDFDESCASDGSDLLGDDDDGFSLSVFGGFELRSPKNLPNPFGGFSLNRAQYLFNNTCKLVYVSSRNGVCELLRSSYLRKKLIVISDIS